MSLKGIVVIAHIISVMHQGVKYIVCRILRRCGAHGVSARRMHYNVNIPPPSFNSLFLYDIIIKGETNMVAVFNIYFDFGGSVNAPGSQINVDSHSPVNLRFKTNDNATIDSIDVIPIPSSGTNYSYWKHIYMQCATAPSTKVDNVKFYTDGGGFGTGFTFNVGTETPTKNHSSSAGYDPATGTPGTTGDVMTDHDSVTGSADAFSFTSASPKTLSISEASSQIDAVDETTDYLVFQLEVISTASPGDLADETMTIKYDEV